jgi:hypothetical protein
MSPMRVDPVQAFERTIATTEKFVKIANRMDSEKIYAMIKEGKTIETLKWLEDHILAK